MMKNGPIFKRLMSAIEKLSESELRAFSEILRHPNMNFELANIIDSTLKVRRIERNSITKESADKRQGDRVREDIAQESSVTHAHFRLSKITDLEAKNYFFNILNNRKLFPSTRDVVKAINDFFDFDFDYDTYRKRGRRDLIKSCWSRLSSLPNYEREKKLIDFIRKQVKNDYTEDKYQDLFRYLVRDE